MNTTRSLSILLLFAAGCATSSQTQAPPATAEAPAATASAASPAHENLNAVLWVQTSAEYHATAQTEYQVARIRLDEALGQKDWTAATEQTEGFADKPPAIIVDVDETVLDNSAYQARLVKNGGHFATETWNAWCEERAAAAIPGALEFAKYAAERGVTVFYITNRDHAVEDATKANLQKLGFPIPEDRDVVLTVGEKPDWTSDKTSRRATVASEFRVLLMFGDALGDFVPDKGTPAERMAAANEHLQMWGTRWFMIPNPMYGHWEAAAFGYDYDLGAAEKAQMKVDALHD